VSAPHERSVDVNGTSCRVWEKGSGAPLGVLAGFGGFPRWTPFLEALATQRRVVVPSLPGFPGALGHERLDDLPDWIAATLDLLEGAGLAGADLVGLSVGGALAAEAAACSPELARRLVLVAPFGLYDEGEPTADPWAQRLEDLPALLCADPARFAAEMLPASGEDAVERQILVLRAFEAAARLLWPIGDLGLRKRLHRIRRPTLLVWGAADRVVPPSYAKRFADAIAGPTAVRSIEGAGHRADLDAPDALADAILRFLAESLRRGSVRGAAREVGGEREGHREQHRTQEQPEQSEGE
jgi:pimeloyl-ACP methyl ester carboxylesterase